MFLRINCEDHRRLDIIELATPLIIVGILGSMVLKSY
jgi:hypothetical protein